MLWWMVVTVLFELPSFVIVALVCQLCFLSKMIQKVRTHPELEGEIVDEHVANPLPVDLEAQRNYGSICLDSGVLSSLTASQAWIFVVILFVLMGISLSLFYMGNGDLLTTIWNAFACKMLGIGCATAEPMSISFKA